MNQPEIEQFFADVGNRVQLAEEEQIQRDRTDATRFNVFGLIDPDENKFSDILKDLLDPEGTHGQGDIFLRLLLEKLDDTLHCKRTTKATVRREACTFSLSNQYRRMDILVETDIILAIENKIGSPEQDRQIKDYLKHLANYTSSGRQQYALIYLTPDGHQPESLTPDELRIAKSEKHLFCWSYQRELKEWLESCRWRCEAQKVQFFISDFIGCIESHMQQKQTTSTMNTKPIQEYIIRSEENLQNAAVVSEAWPEARQKLVEGFLARLKMRLEIGLSGWEFGQEGTIYIKDYATFDFWKPTWREQYGLSLQWGLYGKEMVFGVYREKDKIGNRPFSNELLEAIKKPYSWAIASPWYEARIIMKDPASDWSIPDILWQMQTEPKFLEEVAKQLLEVARIGEPIIDQLVQKTDVGIKIAAPDAIKP